MENRQKCQKSPKPLKTQKTPKNVKIVNLVYQRGDQTTFFFVYPPPLNQSLIRGGETPKTPFLGFWGFWVKGGGSGLGFGDFVTF